MSTDRTRIAVLALLVLTVVGGFALRTTLNVDAAQTEDGQFLLSGNDPYYHKHAVDHIVEEGETLRFDPMLNYPVGSTNPNPPLYEWSVAVGSHAIEPFVADADAATWWSILYAPSIWGTLTIIPVYLIAKEFAGPWGGLLAGFLIATSPEHMSRTSLGFSDHDAINLFLISFGFYFLIRSMERIGTNPQDTQAREFLPAFTDWFTTNRASSGAAIAAGGFFGALALTWKGFPYVFGIGLALAGLILLVNHWRQKDVSRPFFAIAAVLAVAGLMSLPHYLSLGLMHFWKPAAFIFAALLVTGLFFMATQRYPAVLVIPGLVLVAAIFATVMFLVFPSISGALLNRFVYFNQNRLYQTIAEARPASFSNLSFTVGPIPFFLYVVGIPWLGYRLWRDKRPEQFVFFSWAVVDLFMGVSAVRFLSLIVPSMAILAATTAVWLIRAMDLPNLADGYKMAGGGWRGIRRATGMMHIVVILFIGLLVLVPNAFFAVDAAVPSNFENEKISEARGKAFEDVTAVAKQAGVTGQNLTEIQRIVNGSRNADQFENRLRDARLRLGLPQTTVDRIVEAGKDEMKTVGFYSMRFGAFGQSYLPDGWRRALNHLATLDTDQPPPERPAFLAWWDYGHWSISVGKHPAVADNFQNGFRAAGNFLVAQNESHAIQVMGARYAKIIPEDEYVETLQERGISKFNATRLHQKFTSSIFPYIPFAEEEGENREISADWLGDLEEISGKKIRYVAADNRMLPIDDPRTQRIESGSIYYAPVTLAGKNPDDFVESSLVNQQTGEKMTEEELRRLQRQQQQQQPQVGQQLFYKEAFFNSMYYRAFVGLPAREPFSQGGQQFPIPFQLSQYPEFFQGREEMLISRSSEVNGLALTQEVAPGFGLRHFRLIYANDAVRLLHYYPGATVTGQVTVAGQPLGDVRVTVFDDAGDQVMDTNTAYFLGRGRTAEDLDVPHDSVLTDANGTFELVAPFGEDRGVDVRVTQEAQRGRGAPPLLAEETLQISEADAERGASFTVDFRIEPANVTGVTFHDVDADGERDPDEDLLSNVTLEMQGKSMTTGPDGQYRFEDLKPGQHRFQAETDGFQMQGGQGSVQLESGETLEHDIGFEYVPVRVNGTIVDQGGDVVEGLEAQFSPAANDTARQTSAVSRINGSLSLGMQPGTYRVHGNGTRPQTDTTLVIESVEVVEGSGVLVDDEGNLVLDPDARGVEIRIHTRPAE